MRTYKKICTFVMKIHLVKKQTIRNYAANNVQSRESLDAWLRAIKKEDWNTYALFEIVLWRQAIYYSKFLKLYFTETILYLDRSLFHWVK